MGGMVRRLLLVAAFVLLGIAAAVGCSPAATPTPTPTPTPSPTPAPREVTITWSFWGDPWEVDANERVVKVFHADYPGINVKTVHEPWNTYFQKAEEWWKGGSPPDVMFMDYIPVYAAKGYLEPLDGYVQRDSFDIGDFYPGLLTTYRWDNNLWGLPRDNDTKVIFYNKTLFDNAGVPYPKQGWTWEDLRQAALKLTKREGGQTTQYGFAYEPDEWWRLWVWQNGGEVYDNDSAPTKTLMDSAAAAEAVQFFADLTNVDKVTPSYLDQQTSLNIGKLFQEGKLAMAFGNHALVPGFAATQGLKWDVAGLPKNKAQVNSAGGSGYVISSASKEKEAAWTFLKWLQSSKGQAIFAETGVIVPARRSVGQAPIFQQQGSYDATVFIDETERGRPLPMFDGIQQVTTLFNEALVPVWEGKESAGDALAAAVPRVNALLGKR